MSKPKTDDELDTVLADAKAAQAEALKLRARANHSAAVVQVAHEAHAAALAKAAEHRVEADAGDKVAQEKAGKARLALEKGLDLAAAEEKHEAVPAKPVKE